MRRSYLMECSFFRYWSALGYKGSSYVLFWLLGGAYDEMKMYLLDREIIPDVVGTAHAKVEQGSRRKMNATGAMVGVLFKGY